MPLPGVTVTRADRGPAAISPDDVGGLFAVGLTERGPVDSPVEVRSLNQYLNVFGGYAAYSTLARPVEAYFREGGTRVVVVRLAGEDARPSRKALLNASDTVMTLEAANPGAWGDTLSVQVTTATGNARTIVILRDGRRAFSGTFATYAEAVAGLNSSGLVTVVSGTAARWPVDPVTTAAPFAGGDDDRDATNDDAVWAAALDRFDRDLGPGTVAAPGRTSEGVHRALFAHARQNNRFALADAPDTDEVATLTAAAAPLRDSDDAAYGQLLAPWEQTTIGGVTVPLPPSASQAGRMALTDRDSALGPGQTAAGRFAVSNWSTGVSHAFGDADRETLNDAGVTVIRGDRGEVRAYGGLTLVDPQTFPQFAEAAGMRLAMAIESEAAALLEDYVMATIDGRGSLLSAIHSALVGVVKPWYVAGALHGATDAEAYSIDLGPAVNPPEQLAQRRVAAVIEIRTSPFAERIVLTINKVAAGDVL